MQKYLATSLAGLLVAGQMASPALMQAQSYGPDSHSRSSMSSSSFGENISFDHYFGTYPNALNPPREPRFVAAPGTPTVNGYTDGLLFNNPNFLNKTGNAGRRPIPSASIARSSDCRSGSRLHS